MSDRANASAMVGLLWQRRRAPLAAPHACSGAALCRTACSGREALPAR